MPTTSPGVSVHDEDIKIKKGGWRLTFHQLVRQIDTSPRPGRGGEGEAGEEGVREVIKATAP